MLCRIASVAPESNCCHGAVQQPRPPRPRRRAAGARQPAALPPGLEDGGGALGSAAGALLHPVTHVREALAGEAQALLALEGLLVTAAAFAAAAWADRPRGWARRELLEVGDSPVAGQGVFAAAPIERGTVLGQYPGRPRTPAAMAAKCEAAPRARGYCFRTRVGTLLDPTDADGLLSAAPAPGLPWLPIDFTLAYINEPPPGVGGCNVTVEDDPSDACGLLCVAARAISPGEELFMDYGPTYDRSSYTRAAGGGGGRQQPRRQQGQEQGDDAER